MDSLNLSESENTQQNSKNTASNTSPIACAHCGSKYYVQILPQPYCFRTHQPEIPKCKRSQKDAQENFMDPQAVFPFFPMLHPIFPNRPLPLNYCYVHDHLEESNINEKKKFYPNESENISKLPKQDVFSQKEKNDIKGNKNPINESAQIHNNIPGAESQFLGHPFNLMDPQLNSLFHHCSWGDFIPWTCSSFIAPIMSYCLFLNSQKLNYNNNNLIKNWTETSGQKINENPQTFSSPNNEYSKDLNKECDEKINSTERKTDSLEDSLEAEVYDNDEQNSRNLANLSNLNYNGENCFKNVITEDIDRCTYGFCEGEDAEMEGFSSAVQLQSDHSFEINEKDILNCKTASHISLEPNDNIKPNLSQSPLGSDISNLMAGNSNENAVDGFVSEMQVNSSATSLVDDNAFLQDLDNESGKRTPSTETVNFQDRIPVKKLFKNFTVADQANNNFFGKTRNTGTASGDLGGETCAGYKMNIESYEKEQEKNCHEIEEVFEPKQSVTREFEIPEKNKQKNVLDKNTNENLKSGRNFKSGIAKLSTLSKSKESKTDFTKYSKNNKESNQKEVKITKRKHNCLYNNNNNNNINGNDNSPKILKTKNCTVIQQETTGMEKDPKENNIKSQNVKREKKMQRLKSER